MAQCATVGDAWKAIALRHGQCAVQKLQVPGTPLPGPGQHHLHFYAAMLEDSLFGSSNC